jgi:Flp pilus assembly protein TadD
LNELGAVLIKNQDYSNAETILQRARLHAVGGTAVRVANNLASVAALRGDVAAAESLYQSALTMAGTSPERASDRRSIEKNLQDLKAGR